MANRISVHEIFVGTTLTSQQNALYESAFGRGFSTKNPEPSLVDATLVLALSMAKGDGEGVYSKVLIYAPSNLHKMVFEQIHKLAVNLTIRVSSYKQLERKKKSMEVARNWLEVLMVGAPKLGDLSEEPERWVAIGYSKDDLLPDWLKKALL